jgi:hypothetical protein
MYPQQWEAVFSVGFVKGVSLKTNVATVQFCVLSSESDCYSSCVLVVVPGEDQCMCKPVTALYLDVIKRDCNEGANKSNHPN